MKVQEFGGAFALPPLVPRIPVARLVGHENQAPISVVQFTADGKYCFTGGHDRSVKLWNPSRLDPAFPPPPRRTTSHKNNSKNRQTDDNDDDVPVEELPQSLCIQTYQQGITHEVSALAVDAGCQTLIIACDKFLVIHDVVSGICHSRRLGPNHHTARINAVALGGGGEVSQHGSPAVAVTTYLTASYDASVKIWDARNTRSYEPIQSLNDAKDSVTDVHLDHLSSYLIRTSSIDGVLRTYDLRKGLLINDDFGVAITSMVQSHDGQTLAVHGLDDATIRLLDLSPSNSSSSLDMVTNSSNLLLNTFSGQHKAGKYALKCAFSGDDTAVVTGSDDGTAVVYHAVTAEPVALLRGHSQPTCAVAAAPNNTAATSSVITASFDGNAIVWAQDLDYMKWQ